ncbi:response regulator transcription factor [Microbacterium sp. SSW1-49]|uniref:Response regulator transcription factor n=1 Tax=Microbacterium croceum TaxID=2851645 RepID=A0ABT0FIM2_9MICO|nr:response regulator transcription factor [Microbacterium croceum]MCK2037900.1 response regulator transcription factor [Microbacterium croceum]
MKTPSSDGSTSRPRPAPSSRPKTLNIGLVDDHPALVVGVSTIINSFSGMRVTGAASRVDALLDPGGSFDVVLLDLQLADGSSPRRNVERLLAGSGAAVKVIAFTSGENAALVREAAHAGVVGMLRKSELPDKLRRAIEAAHRGETIATPDWAAALMGDEAFVSASLSARERDVLSRYASGQTAEKVAAALVLSRDTVVDHLRRIRSKYAAVGREAPTKIDLHRRAIEDGLI